jgi:hypothetical protein
MLVKLFQASGPEAAKKVEDQINAWLQSPEADDPEIEQVSTSVCPAPGGREGDVCIVVTILFEAD